MYVRYGWLFNRLDEFRQQLCLDQMNRTFMPKITSNSKITALKRHLTLMLINLAKLMAPERALERTADPDEKQVRDIKNNWNKVCVCQ